MGIPHSIEARQYYRCAFERDEDARILLVRGDRTTGAVYLAGYAIECILKALILSTVPKTRETEILELFRGAKAHSYEWLRTLYVENGGVRFPPDVNKVFTLVSDWSTDLRYVPRTLTIREADAFLAASERILLWADGRF